MQLKLVLPFDHDKIGVTFWPCCFKMLANEVIEDSLISFLTQEAPNADIDGEPISQKVLYGDIFSIQECVRLPINHVVVVFLNWQGKIDD